jgi:hypothetical protein
MSRWASLIGISCLVSALFLIEQGTAAVSITAAQEVDEPIDFIRFNGAIYLSTIYLAENSSRAAYTPIGRQDLGPAVGQVVTNWIDANDEAAYPNEPCFWDAPDGTAPRLAPGDAIYAVRGYATTFRLAARQDEGFVSYQVWCSDDAEVGADLFDIFNRVERISVTADVSETSGFAVIDDQATISRLVGMLLEGKVIPEELSSTAPVTHQLIIHLDDGTTFRASAAPEEFLWGLGAVSVPAAFTEILDRAWTAHLDESGVDSA